MSEVLVQDTPAEPVEQIVELVPEHVEPDHVEPAEPEQPAPKPRRARHAKADAVEQPAEPVVAEVMEPETPEATDEVAEPEAEVAKRGLQAWWAARGEARQESRRREAVARAHAAEELELAREAAGRLQPGHNKDDLRAMVATVRQERAEAAASQASEARKTADLAEAARLDSEASALEQAVETTIRAQWNQHHARFEQVRPTAEAALRGMREAEAAREEYLTQAQANKARAAELRAQYAEPVAEAA